MGKAVADFHWVDSDEPHAARREQILAKYPQIKELYGADVRLFPCVLALVVFQLWLATQAVRLPSLAYWLVAYSVGGTVTHALNLASHELSHQLCFESIFANELLGCFANLAHGLPSAITFKKYHLLHHYRQGHEGLDTDVPTNWERTWFTTAPRKLLWCFLQPVFYALRPLAVCPKPLLAMEYFNLVSVVAFDCWLGWAYGIWAVVFLWASLLLGMGLHPLAGHFIAEHYEFTRGQETYSYYGPLNWLSFNVGYHNEHHDFPKVSGFRLPCVRNIAPEFYGPEWKSMSGAGLTIHTSWIKVIYDYIMNPQLGPSARVKRRKAMK